MSASFQIATTYEAVRIYTDSGTGASQDLCVWQPQLSSGYYMIGHFGQRDHADVLKGPIPIVKPIASGVFAAPASFERMWKDSGSGGTQDVAFWRVIAPPGYTALEDVISANSYDPPNNLKAFAVIWWNRAGLAILYGQIMALEPERMVPCGQYSQCPME